MPFLSQQRDLLVPPWLSLSLLVQLVPQCLQLLEAHLLNPSDLRDIFNTSYLDTLGNMDGRRRVHWLEAKLHSPRRMNTLVHKAVAIANIHHSNPLFFLLVRLV